MPTKKYRVDTDKGSYEVEVEVPDPTSGEKMEAARHKEPDSYWSGFLTGGLEGMGAGFKGFAENLVPGTVKAAIGLPMAVVDLVKELFATGEGAVGLVTDPVGTLTKAAENIGSLPAKAQEALRTTMQLAAQDPEAFGKEVANLTGQAAVGVATAKAVPLAPKPIARTVGNIAEQVGTKGAWPIRMMGAHQLGAGNPMGIATMMLPEALKKGGEGLTKFGAKEPGVIRLGAPEQRFAADIEKTLTKNIDALGNPVKAGLKDVDAAIASEKKNAGAIRLTSAKREATLKAAEEAADLAHQTKKATANATVDAEQQKLLDAFQKRKATAATDIEKQLGKSIDDAGNPAAAGLEDLDAAIADEGKAGAARRAASAKRELELKAQETIDAAKAGLTKGTPKITETVKAPGQTMSTSYAAETSGLTPFEQELLSRSIETKPAGQALADKLAPKVKPPMVPKAAAPIEEPILPANRTQRSPTAAGLSQNDVDALKQIVIDNPEITPDEAAAELLKQRGQRSTGYRDSAVLSKLEQAALDRDE